jgi:hypothetical protein
MLNKMHFSTLLKLSLFSLMLCILPLASFAALSQRANAQVKSPLATSPNSSLQPQIPHQPGQTSLHWNGWKLRSDEGTTDASVATLPGTNGFPTTLFSKGINDHQVYVNHGDSQGAQLLPGGMQTNVALNTIRFVSPGHPPTATGFYNPYLFANGMNDHRIYYNVVGIQGWQEVPGSGTTDAALASAVFNNKLYLFAKGVNDDSIYMNIDDGSTWSGWSTIPGNGHTDAALSATVYGAGLHLFAKGINDDGIYENDFNGSGWTGWFSHQSGGHTDRALASIAYNGSLYLFAKGVNDNGIYVDSMQNGTWQGWQVIGGTTNVALAASTGCGDLELYSKGINDSRIYENTASDSSGTLCAN